MKRCGSTDADRAIFSCPDENTDGMNMSVSIEDLKSIMSLLNPEKPCRIILHADPCASGMKYSAVLEQDRQHITLTAEPYTR